jgi:hypothetical protein
MSLEEAQDIVRFIVANWKTQREEFWMIKQDLNPHPFRVTSDAIATHFMAIKKEIDEEKKQKEKKPLTFAESRYREIEIIKNQKLEDAKKIIEYAKKVIAEYKNNPDSESLKQKAKFEHKRGKQAQAEFNEWMETRYPALLEQAERDIQKENEYQQMPERIRSTVRTIDHAIEDSKQKLWEKMNKAFSAFRKRPGQPDSRFSYEVVRTFVKQAREEKKKCEENLKTYRRYREETLQSIQKSN